MASIYQKTVSDKTCILAPREFILRPFDFGAWTEMRVGMYFSGVASSGDNTDSAVEAVTLSAFQDYITFGIKDSATNDLPGYGDALFLGACTVSSGTSYCSGSNFQTQGGSFLASSGFHETTLVNGTSHLDSMVYPASAAGATGYCAFYAMKFVIANLGASSQAVTISSCTTSPIAGTDYSAAALQIALNGATYGSATSVAWNTGAAARTIPDAFFLRLPFYSNRIRLSAIFASRYAP